MGLGHRFDISDRVEIGGVEITRGNCTAKKPEKPNKPKHMARRNETKKFKSVSNAY